MKFRGKSSVITGNMSKIRGKTGKVCLVCDETLCEYNTVVMHKTRRQSHNLCIDCAIGYITPVIKVITNNLRQNIRKDVQFVQCPGGYHSLCRNRCKTKVDVRKLEFPPECTIYTDIIRIQFVLGNDMAFICPDEKCGGVVEVAQNYTNIKLRCPHCMKEWCRQCLVAPYHEGKSCIEYEIEHNDTPNGQYILKMSKAGLIKFCPRCRAPIERPSGCNKMYCCKCMTKWCWLCQKTGIDYSHFNANNPDGCANRLWEATNGDYAAQVRAALGEDDIKDNGEEHNDIPPLQDEVAMPNRPPILRRDVAAVAAADDPWAALPAAVNWGEAPMGWE